MTRIDPPAPGYLASGDGRSTSSGTTVRSQSSVSGASTLHSSKIQRKAPKRAQHQWQLDLQRATSNPNLRSAAASSVGSSDYDIESAASVFSAFALDDNVLRGASTANNGITRNPFTTLNDAKARHAWQDVHEAEELPPAYEADDGPVAKIAQFTSLVDKKPASSPPPGFHCQRCKEGARSPDRIAQIPSCDHIVCVQCLSFHIVKELGASRYPVECPVCTTAGTRKDLCGVVNVGIAETCALPPLALEAFHDFSLSQHSTRVTCPQCLNSMLLEREQYMNESVIVCPLLDCGHRWCKQCQKQMPVSPVQVAKHACKPCDGRVCPGCGALGKQVVSSNKHVKCKEFGCGMHYCYDCGDPIGQDGITPNLDGAIVAHLKQCGSRKYCVIM